MSDDLISRSELKKEIEGMSCTDYCDIFDWKVNEGVLNALNDVKDIIDDMPTAYDVDEKIAKLEALKVPEGIGANCPYNRERCEESNCQTCILDYAIDIVKGGAE